MGIKDRKLLTSKIPHEVSIRIFVDCNRSDCWTWLGEVSQGNHPIIRLGGRRKRIAAHRYLYKILIGQVDDKLYLDHLCRNRRCINPEHLEPVTSAENCRRGNASVLTKDEVIQIRNLYNSRNFKQKDLAKKFKVSDGCISSILNGRSWKDIGNSIPRPIKYSIITTKLSNNVKAYRKQHPKLSQRKIARVFNVSQTTIGKILNS